MTNLGVVGAGVGGCSAAYFASKHLPESKVTVYEKEDRVGGRVCTFRNKETRKELGAEFLNSGNKTVCQLVKETGLELQKLEELMDIAVWNGTEITFKSGQPMFYRLLKLVSKYKLNVPKLLLMLKQADGKLKELYKNAETSPAEFWQLFADVGLDEYYKTRFDEALVKKGVDQKIIDELITPITRIIYSQNATLGGFAGLSALLGVYGEAVYRFKDGNDVFPRKLLEVSEAKVENSRVISIEKTSEGSFRVTAEDRTEVFDTVVVAVPLKVANIAFDGIEKSKLQEPEYQKIYIRLMKGQVNPKFFNLDSSELPSVILTTTDTDPLTRFSIIKSTKKNEHWITVTSTKPLNGSYLEGLFKNGTTVLDHTWNSAYPMFKPTQKLPSSCLDKGLMYVNAIETAVSSMETTTFAASNCIKTLKQQFK
jgi:prenylcysteine oxidase / farnesylcysteine lyase